MTDESKAPDLWSLPEAPVSVNFFGISKTGWNLQLTLRDFDEDNLIDRMGKLIKRLESAGVTPKPVGRQPDAVPSNGNPSTTLRTGPSAPLSAGGQPLECPPSAGQLAQLPTAEAVPLPVDHASTERSERVTEETFEAEQLVANVSSGKTYWKVKGGKYAKFGVTVWPEVLDAAGLASDKLDPTQTYSLTGYKAYYTTSDGKPQKVTKLEK